MGKHVFFMHVRFTQCYALDDINITNSQQINVTRVSSFENGIKMEQKIWLN